MLVAIPNSVLSTIMTINNKSEYPKKEAQKRMNLERDFFMKGILSMIESDSKRLIEITK